MDHCTNYDPAYEGCRECPGKLTLIRGDGSVDTICRAGERHVRRIMATADNDLPVYLIPFPADEPRRPA